MGKTPEQSQADDQLEAAVQAVVRAYGIIPEKALVNEYVVVVEAVEFMDDGDDMCEIALAFRNGHGRFTNILGILELGKVHMMKLWSAENKD